MPEHLTLFSSHEELVAERPDFLFSLGGDGTILNAVTYVRASNIPILGINTGRLGFLSNVSKDQVAVAVEGIYAGKYSIENRALLAVDTKEHLFGDMNFALNELTVHKKDSSSMITINAYADGEFS